MFINSRGFSLRFLAFLDGLWTIEIPALRKAKRLLNTLLKSFSVSPCGKLNSLK